MKVVHETRFDWSNFEDILGRSDHLDKIARNGEPKARVINNRWGEIQLTLFTYHPHDDNRLASVKRVLRMAQREELLSEVKVERRAQFHIFVWVRFPIKGKKGAGELVILKVVELLRILGFTLPSNSPFPAPDVYQITNFTKGKDIVSFGQYLVEKVLGKATNTLPYS